MSKTLDQFIPGQRVRITQQIPQRDEVWTTTAEGVVVRAEQKKTGSWFAHAKDDRLWLDRLVIQKDDGEVLVSILDKYTHVEAVDPPAAADEAAADESAPEAPSN